MRGSKPSISVRIWLSVCSRSSWPPEMFGPPGRARAADGVELVDEDDRGRRLPWPARTGRARARRRRRRSSRRTPRPTSGRTARPPRRRRRAPAASCRCRARRSAARRAGSGRRAEVLVRVLEEVDDLGQLLLGLVDPGDVLERDGLVGGLDAPRARAPEATSARRRRRRRAARRIRNTNSSTSSSVGPKPKSRLGQERRARCWLGCALIVTPFALQQVEQLRGCWRTTGSGSRRASSASAGWGG